MTDDLQELDGVGPAREEKLNDEGYETYAELGEADHEELAESINRLSEDAALDLVVQAQNMADLEEAEVEESDDEGEPEVEEEAEESDDEEEPEPPQEADFTEEEDADADEADSASENEEDEPEPEVEAEATFTVTLDFDGVHEYDTFYHTLLEERCNLRRTNRAGVESYEKMLESLRGTSADGSFTVELSEDELNDLHNAVLEQRISYQGENLIDYMDALRVVENNVNAVREEFLF